MGAGAEMSPGRRGTQVGSRFWWSLLDLIRRNAGQMRVRGLNFPIWAVGTAGQIAKGLSGHSYLDRLTPDLVIY